MFDEASLAALEGSIAALSASEAEELERALTDALAEAQAAARPAPALMLALAACYGRKGLATKAYEAVSAAERAAKEPGVRLSLAVIHGRKALLVASDALPPCSLTVESDPPGALVLVDGVPLGTAPARLSALRAGKHELVVRLPGYLDSIELFDAPSGGALHRSAVLVPAPVACLLEAEPAGAALTLDGAPLGTAPWSGSLRPGDYALSATHPGYELLRRTFRVELGSERAVARLELVPLDAVLIVTSEPPGGIVTLGGVEIGRTPLRHATKRFDLGYVRLRHPEYLYIDSPPIELRLEPGKESSVSHRFVRKRQPLMLAATDALPEGAVIYLDGKEFDRVPSLSKELDYGMYDIEIRAPGFEPLQGRLDWSGTNWPNRFRLVRTLPLVAKGAITLDGRLDDWASLPRLLSDPTGDDRDKATSGTDVIAVFAASDGDYLYVRIDLADGVMKSQPGRWKEQTLKIDGDKDGAGQYFIYLSLGQESENLAAFVRVNKRQGSTEKEHKRVTRGCSYKQGDGFVELRFPISAFSDFIKATEVYEVWCHVGAKYPTETDETGRILLRFISRE